MKYPKRSQYKYAKSQYRVRNWAQYEAGLTSPSGIHAEAGLLMKVVLEATACPTSATRFRPDSSFSRSSPATTMI